MAPNSRGNKKKKERGPRVENEEVMNKSKAVNDCYSREYVVG